MTSSEIEGRQSEVTLEYLASTHPEIDSVHRTPSGILRVIQRLPTRGVRNVEIDADEDGTVTISGAIVFAGPPKFTTLSLQPWTDKNTFSDERISLLSQARLGIRFFDAFSRESDPTKSKGKVVDYARDGEPIASELKATLNEKLKAMHEALGVSLE